MQAGAERQNNKHTDMRALSQLKRANFAASEDLMLQALILCRFSGQAGLHALESRGRGKTAELCHMCGTTGKSAHIGSRVVKSKVGVTSAVDPNTQKSLASRSTIDNALPPAFVAFSVVLVSVFIAAAGVAACGGAAAAERGPGLMVICSAATTRVTTPVDRESPRQPAARASSMPPSRDPRNAPTREDVVRIESAVVRVLPVKRCQEFAVNG